MICSKISFDCESGDVFSAKVSASDKDAIVVHHTPKDEETNEPIFYNKHILYTDSETITVFITPYKKNWIYTDKVDVEITDLDNRTITTEQISLVEETDGSYSFVLPVNASFLEFG